MKTACVEASNRDSNADAKVCYSAKYTPNNPRPANCPALYTPVLLSHTLHPCPAVPHSTSLSCCPALYTPVLLSRTLHPCPAVPHSTPLSCCPAGMPSAPHLACYSSLLIAQYQYMLKTLSYSDSGCLSGSTVPLLYVPRLDEEILIWHQILKMQIPERFWHLEARS